MAIHMSCPGQGRDTGTNADLFFSRCLTNRCTSMCTTTGTPAHTMPNDSQFKCYDGMHNWNRSSRRPYDGMYQFPSVTARKHNNRTADRTNCTICLNNPTGDGTKMLACGQVRCLNDCALRAMN